MSKVVLVILSVILGAYINKIFMVIIESQVRALDEIYLKLNHIHTAVYDLINSLYIHRRGNYTEKQYDKFKLQISEISDYFTYINSMLILVESYYVDIVNNQILMYQELIENLYDKEIEDRDKIEQIYDNCNKDKENILSAIVSIKDETISVKNIIRLFMNIITPSELFDLIWYTLKLFWKKILMDKFTVIIAVGVIM